MSNKQYKTGIILVNFIKDGHHGCEKHCPFCHWNLTNYNIEIKPTDTEVIDFLATILPGAAVSICGGGDPLYNFEENKEYLIHLINLIKNNGYRVTLITKYIETVLNNFELLSTIIDNFSFSTEILDQQVYQAAVKLTDINKNVRVSKVAEYTGCLDTINWTFVEDYCKFYSQIKGKQYLSICFRPNYNFIYDDKELTKVRNKIADLSTKYGCRVYMHNQGCCITTLQLWNNRYVPCYETDSTIEQDLKTIR